jgi:long-chain acyl-CoA synthetase
MYGYLKDSIQDKTKDKLIYFNRKIKGNELFSYIDSLSFYLTKIGVKKGEAVGICLPNIPQAVISLYAINRIGAVANVIHPKISAKALFRIVDQTNTKVIFVFDAMLKYYYKGLRAKGVKIISCSASHFLKGVRKAFAAFYEPDLEEDVTDFMTTISEKGEVDRQMPPFDTAVYLHSGGTTGEPKIVELSSYAFNELVKNVMSRALKNHKYSDEHTMLMILPLFHGFGLGICIHLALSKFKMVMMPRFRAKDAIKLIKKHRINYLAGIPAMYEKIMKEKSFDGKYLSSLMYLFCGAEKLNPEIKKEFDAILKKNDSTAEIYEGYGLSEVASVLTFNVKGECKAGTQGRPIDGAEIKIIDKDGVECPPNVVGETLVKSKSMMNSYLFSDLSESFYIDENGEKWLRTGDLGYLDEDGYYVFKDRIKRMIKIAGVNIFPSEIEQAVCKMKEVDMACVVRTTKNNRPCTKLYLKLNKAFKYSILIENRIKAVIAEEFIKYAVPCEIIAVKEMPLTLMGKVDYKKYEEMEEER